MVKFGELGQLLRCANYIFSENTLLFYALRNAFIDNNPTNQIVKRKHPGTHGARYPRSPVIVAQVRTSKLMELISLVRSELSGP